MLIYKIDVVDLGSSQLCIFKMSSSVNPKNNHCNYHMSGILWESL